MFVIFKPLYNKTNIITCVSSEDPDHPGASTQSDQSLHCALNRKLRAQCFFMQTAKSDQTSDVHADLRLRWAHRSFGLFCCAAAHL